MRLIQTSGRGARKAAETIAELVLHDEIIGRGRPSKIANILPAKIYRLQIAAQGLLRLGRYDSMRILKVADFLSVA